MLEKNKILAQSAPAAVTETVLFTVLASQNAKIQGLSVCNRGVAPSSFRFWFAIKGADTSIIQYVYFDLPISANNTFFSTLEATLLPGDQVRVYTTQGNLTFTLFGLPT